MWRLKEENVFTAQVTSPSPRAQQLGEHLLGLLTSAQVFHSKKRSHLRSGREVLAQGFCPTPEQNIAEWLDRLMKNILLKAANGMWIPSTMGRRAAKPLAVAGRNKDF